jgi:hypothetical protein
MAEAIHTEARFNDENAAREHLESIYWPRGPVCPHCGSTERNTRLNGTAHRPGLLYCADCKSQFTVTVGTVFERSKVALHKAESLLPGGRGEPMHDRRCGAAPRPVGKRSRWTEPPAQAVACYGY